MPTDYLKQTKPSRPHLLRGRGLAGEVARLHREANDGRLFLQSSLNRFSWSPAGNGDLKTWEQVAQRIADCKTPCSITIMLGESYSIPASDEKWELKNSVFETAVGAGTEIEIEDGATLRDCGGGVGPVVFKGFSSNEDHPSFDYTLFGANPLGGPGVLLLQFGAVLKQQGTSPMVIVPPDRMVVLAARYSSPFDPGSLPNQQIVKLNGTAILLLTTIGTSPNIPDDSIGGDALSIIGVQHDGAGKYPYNQSAFNGSVANLPLGANAGAGPTSFRPAGGFGPIPDGCYYYDLTLRKPLWWKSSTSEWLDYNGDPVP